MFQLWALGQYVLQSSQHSHPLFTERVFCQALYACRKRPFSEQLMVLSTLAHLLGHEGSNHLQQIPGFSFGTGALCIPVLPPHWSTHHKGSQKNFCNQPAEHFSPKILAHSARVVTHCREFPNGWWETFCRHPESIPYILDCVPIVAGHDCPLSEQLVLSTQAHLSRQFSEVSRDCDCNNQSRMPYFNFETGTLCIPVLPPHWSTHHKGSQKNYCNQPAEHFSPKILALSARVVTHCREFPNDCWETFCRHPESIPYILGCGPIVAGHDCSLLTNRKVGHTTIIYN